MDEPPTIRSESPFALSVTSDVTMPDMLDKNSEYMDPNDNNMVRNQKTNGPSIESLGYLSKATPPSEYDDDDDDDNFDDDSNQLQTTGSLLDYSDTSEDYTTHYATKKNKKKKAISDVNGVVRRNNRYLDNVDDDDDDIDDHNDVNKKMLLKQKQEAHDNLLDRSLRVVRFWKSTEGERAFDDNIRQSYNDIELQKSDNRSISRNSIEQSDQENQDNSILSWMAHLRSPARPTQKKSSEDLRRSLHTMSSGELEEYPHHHLSGRKLSSDANVISSPDLKNGRVNKLSHTSGPTKQENPDERTSLLSSSDMYRDGLRKSLLQRDYIMKRRRQYKNSRGETHVLINLAAAFLQDYEANRPPTFAYVQDLGDVTRYQTVLHNFKYSTSWFGYPLILWTAVLSMFASSSFERFNNFNHQNTDYDGLNSTYSTTQWNATTILTKGHHEGFTPLTFHVLDHRYILTLLNMIAILIICIDLWIRNELKCPNWVLDLWMRHPFFPPKNKHNTRAFSATSTTSIGSLLDHDVRESRSEKLVKPLMIFCVLLAFENIARIVVVDDTSQEINEVNHNPDENSLVLFSSIMKPIILFYISTQARDALEAVLAIVNIVFRVLAMEMLIILMFAAVACRLFPQYEAFHKLHTAWLSLFELSTTVNNLSLWMPMYANNHTSAIFFIVFVVITVFYLHSLVLSVVFQSYLLSATDIHERSATDRDDALQLAFASLLRLYEESNGNHHHDRTEKLNNFELLYGKGVIDIELVRETLRLVRPHYTDPKINALIEIVDPSGQGTVDSETFRTKIRQALNASIRTARHASVGAVMIELLAVIVGTVNFVYVIVVTMDASNIPEWVGAVITVIAAFELLARFNPFRVVDFTPLTRLHPTFDGLALTAAVVSSWGVVLYCFGKETAFDWILMGRAIDMIRAMRFFPIFRDIVRRSVDVLPALVGPLALVLTTVHVCCYLGMGLWGGAVHVGAHVNEISTLYDLNNFNSYREGMITIFQSLVVNDWNAIARVFQFADRCSNAYIVYPFFVMINLIAVSIMLNVMTAFFVQSFVTKFNDDKDAPAEATTTVPKERSPFATSVRELQLSIRDPVRKILSSSASKSKSSGSFKQSHKSKPSNIDESDRGADADSETSSISEMLEFDVYERECFDTIMQTVSGSHYQTDYARQVCHYLEICERLTPYRDTIGYLVCDQQSLERFGNRRFKTKSIGFLEENELHAVITDVHSELLSLAPRPSMDDMSIQRNFQHKRDLLKVLEISASLLRRHPALSLFVSRITKAQQQQTSDNLLGSDLPPLQQQRTKHVASKLLVRHYSNK